MSKQVDERVVSLQFDNKRFESNVAQSMSTLDKLKQKLNLKGASKGLEEVNTAAKKVDMNGLANGVETVRARFSALDVIGVTALANIANSAVNAGKQLLSSLTIAPVKDGFQEYEMTLNAIQTTMAGTGKTAKEVQDELKKLDEYADKTVYSTADMLNNLPKFTNAGVELENATKAMIGIANATALAGGDAGKASIAFYNLGQAIGTGYLTRMDYNSINNAGIATMEWKNQMVEAAIAQGTLTKVGEDAYQAGSKTLTLQQLFIDGLQEQWATTDVMMKVFGDYGDETTEIGKKSFAAAQDIKTFSMMMDSLKATAGTGWKDTWQIIFGDLDAAKVMWTRLTNFISGIITKMADIRNGILDSALGRGFANIADKIQGVVNPVKNAVDTAKGALKDYNAIVDEIIAGKWGNAPTRWQDLTKAGYDWAHAQNLVNERLGNSVRHATNYKEAQDGLNKSQEKAAETQKELSKADADRIADLCKLTDAQLLELGYTKEQIKAFRELEKTAKKLGIPISEFLQNIDKIDGRWLLIESFANIGKSLTSVFKAMGQAWKEVFESDGVSTVQKIADALFNAIAAFHRFSRSLLVNKENSDKLTRTFKGLFALLDLIFTIVGGPIKIAFKILSKILGAFDLNLLDLTALIGDAIVGFHDWLDKVLDFTGIFKWLAPYIQKATDAIKNWIDETKPLEKVAGFFKSVGSAIKKAFAAFKDSEAFETGKNIIAGLWQGIQNGAGTLWETITNVINKLIEKAKEILGIHSPSTVFAAIGGFIVAGLLLGITQGFPEVGTKLQELINGCIDFLSGIDFGAIFTGLLASGLLVVGFKLASALESLVSPLEGVGDLLTDVGKSLKKFFKASALKQTSEAVKNFAISIAILVASVWVLTKIKPGDLWGAIGAIAALAAILVVLSFAISKLNSMGDMSLDKTGLKVNKMTSQIIPIAFSLLLVAMAVKQLAKIGTNDLIKGAAAVIILGGVLVGIMAATKLLNSNVDDVGPTLLKMSAAILLMVIVVKMLARMSVDDMVKGGLAIAAFGLIVVGLMAATKLLTGSKNVDKIGGAILKISAALLLMVFTAKIAASMSVEDLIKGTLAVAAFGGIVVGLMTATRLISGSKNIDKIGGTIFKISAALLLMVVTAKIAARMSVEDMVKGGLAIAAFGGIIVGLMAATKLVTGSKNVDKIGGAIFKISLAIGIMAVTCALLGMLKIETLAKGVIAVGLFSAMIAGLIIATRGANDVKGNIMAITAAIAVMAIAVTALSFIDPAKLASATLAMGALMGLFALVIKVSGSAQKAMGTIITLTVAIAAIGGVIYLVGQLEPTAALASATALSILLLAMSGSLVILGTMGKHVKDAVLGVLGLLALCVPLVAIAGILCMMKDVANAVESAKALTLLATALSLLLLPLCLVWVIYAASGGIAAIGLAGLLAMCLPLWAIASILKSMKDVDNATESAKALIGLITVLTDTCVKLAIVGPLALVGVAALAALTGLVIAIGGLAVGIGWLMEHVDGLREFLNTGLAVFIQLAGGLGEMISAFMGGLVSGLPEIGTQLSLFITNAMPFINGIKLIDETALNGIKTLAAAIVLLTAADLIEGITSFLSGGESFSSLGTELSLFMMNAMPFITGAAMIKPEMMTGIKTLAEAILVLTGANMLEQISSWLGGESSLATFGSQLGQLGTDLKTFVANLGTFTEDQVTAVRCAGKAIKALADAAATIPNEGGLWGAIVGENSLATFGSKLPKLGLDLAGFITNLGTFGEDKVTVVDCAGKAIKALAEAAGEIPNEGGLWASIVGDNSLATFGSKLPKLGTDLAGFITNLGTFDESHIATVNCAGKAIKALADAANKIPNEGGFWAKLAGDNSLATFGSKLPGLGSNIAGFVKNLGTFGEGQIATVNSATKAIKAIVNLGKIDLDDTSSGIIKLGKKLKSFAKKIKEFIEAMGEVSADSVSSAIKKIKDLINLAKTAAETNIDSLSTFGKTFKKVATDAVKGFVKEFTGESPKSQVKKAAKELLNAFIKAAKDKKDDVNKAFKSIAEAASKKVATKELKEAFKTAGKDLVTGFANGIKNNKYLATDAGSALGKAALKAAKEALDENSPSKEMYKVGDFAGIGFINALYDSVAGAYTAGKELGNSALDSTRSVMSRIVDAINGDMDMQPSIRPVLDLTDVRAGVNNIGSMLSGTRTLAVNTAGIGAISANMSEIQNGRNNSDVVSAIKALRKDMANMPHESVTINGITYDDGSNIVGAVESLVRAAKIERRI